MPHRFAALVLAIAAVLHVSLSSATEPDISPELNAASLQDPEIPEHLLRKPLVGVSVLNEAGRWSHRETLTRVRLGQATTPELVRRALGELLETGRYASAEALVTAAEAGAELQLIVVPRRIVKDIHVQANAFDHAEIVRAARLQPGDELTPDGLRSMTDRVRVWLRHRGYPHAAVTVRTLETEAPIAVLVHVDVSAGSPATIDTRQFAVQPFPPLASLRGHLDGYAVRAGDIADERLLDEADTSLAVQLRAAGWLEAAVDHELRGEHGRELRIVIHAGPFYMIRFEGVKRFDSTTLLGSLMLQSKGDPSTPLLVERLRDFYRNHGLLDARVRLWESKSADGSTKTLRFSVNEGEPVRIVQRFYPCLLGPRDAGEVDSEIESILDEELPGPPFFGAANAKVLGATNAPARGGRAEPFVPDPFHTYVPEVYDRGIAHLQEMYRSEGWLSATVDPPVLMRRACHPDSPPRGCIPVGALQTPEERCLYDRYGVPLPIEHGAEAGPCSDRAPPGVSCENEARLFIPIRIGPRSMLHDVEFAGNAGLVDVDLFEAAELELGGPVSLAGLESARRRIASVYAEEGFAFASVEYRLALSPDKSRARAIFDINEGERVIVSKVIIAGAHGTNESLLRRRIALREGLPYRRSLVRATEERLATLGVFSSITVGMEDPQVPAREKVVLVNVVERLPQYLDVRPGFSTGEGLRIALEYGHRNVASEAIALTLRVQLGYLPSALILESDVRQKYDDLEDMERLERRNSARLDFPEIGLGPLFPFSVEGVDVRDNARDFGLTKDAGIVTLTYRPSRRVSVQAGSSIERNTATIFGTDASTARAIATYIAAHPSRRNSFRVPEGTSVAFAQRFGFTWDRRNAPLDATSGTLVSTSVEHVHAVPVRNEAASPPEASSLTNPFAMTTSDFLRLTQRLAAYVQLSRKGVALAGSFSWGRNHQLVDGSRTYPDRLFFLGGAGSLRGFLQDSLVPEDVAEQLLAPDSDLTLNQVVIRGGDFFVNPRAELRIPLGQVVQTALFLDAGNLWANLQDINYLRLRYAIGSGLRVATPVGPLAFDYGFNVERIMDRLFPNRRNQRTWESLGAFHFSIGLF